MADAGREIGQAWRALESHLESERAVTLRERFAADPDRFTRFSRSCGDLVMDYSKTLVGETTISLLLDLARAAGVEEKRDAMFAGEIVNPTERRAVLHTALRAPAKSHVEAGGIDVMPQVTAVLQRMRTFARAVRDGTLKAEGGRPFTDVINIGIGGSDLGPAMVTQALTPWCDGPRVHFVSNVDPSHLTDTLENLDPASTLVIVASKTFTTAETMANARAARAWIVGALGEAAVASHFAALSTALDKVDEFGIHPDHVFGFWDWVGGRYSLWSAIGLPVMIAAGPEDFDALLAGAHAMDEHYRTAPLEDNLPVLMGMTGIWHRNFHGFAARAILPYDQHLARLAAWAQQLDMESNGKSVKTDGTPVTCETVPVIWGEPGTNGQHAFFQALHQGTQVVPCEFLIAARGHGDDPGNMHAMLAANCLAQSEALMKGRTPEEARTQMLAAGMEPEEAERLMPHKTFPGNRPSTTLVYPRLTPDMLGRILALYEHRTFVEGAVWGVNSFDQWGVELGKELATRLLPAVTGESSYDGDSSTAGLLACLAAHR